MKSIVKNFSFLLFVMLLVLLAACGQNDAEETGADSSNSAEETASADSDNNGGSGDSIELSISHFTTTEHGYHKTVFVPFAEELEERTEGRITATIYPGAALGDPPSQYELVTEGIADISYALQGYTPGRFPLTSVVELPFIADSPAKATGILNDLYEQFPEFQEEYRHNQLLWLFGIDTLQLVTTKKPIESMDDFKGLKIAVPNEIAKKVVEIWGGTAVMMSMPEYYESLQRGVVDGGLAQYSAIKNFGLADVIGYVTEADFLSGTFVISMNKERFESLSEEDQEIIMDMAEKYQQKSIEAYENDEAEGKELVQSVGAEIIKLSDEEMQKFHEAVEPIYQDWIKEMEDNGLPGEEVYNAAVELGEKYD